jgi:hypothetical protein
MPTHPILLLSPLPPAIVAQGLYMDAGEGARRACAIEDLIWGLGNVGNVWREAVVGAGTGPRRYCNAHCSPDAV